MARILFLSQLLPYPLDSGVKFRTYYILRQLCIHHQVTLLCFVRQDNTPSQISFLKTYCHEVHTILMKRSITKNVFYGLKSLLTNQSFIITRDHSSEMEEAVDDTLSEAESTDHPFDAIHCDQLWMAQYAIRGKNQKKIIDQHNAVYLIPKRMAKYEINPFKRFLLELEWRKLARYEAKVCKKFSRVLTVTDVDKKLIQDLIGDDCPPIQSLPICLDPDDIPQLRLKPKRKSIIHLGTMFWPPNVDGVLWFTREIFPFIRNQIPDVEFIVIGKNPPPEILALSTQPGIQVTGYVIDPAPYLENAAASIIPVRSGGGMRVKIIDGWLKGIPMVSTTIGAEGIEIENGINIIIADEAQEFACSVIDLLRNPQKGLQLVENGRRWAELKYDWRTTYSQLDEIYGNLLSC